MPSAGNYIFSKSMKDVSCIVVLISYLVLYVYTLFLRGKNEGSLINNYFYNLSMLDRASGTCGGPERQVEKNILRNCEQLFW